MKLIYENVHSIMIHVKNIIDILFPKNSKNIYKNT